MSRSLDLPGPGELRTPNPLAHFAAGRWRLRRSGASEEDIDRLRRSLLPESSELASSDLPQENFPPAKS
jgi:hypothetical protein